MKNNIITIIVNALIIMTLTYRCKTPVIEDCNLEAKFSYTFKDDTTVIFQNESPNNSSISYTWDFDDGGSSNEYSPIYKYRSSGQKFVKLTLNEEGGCIDTVRVAITVKKETPIAQFSTVKTAYQPDETVTFENKSINALTYEWDFGDPDRIDDISNGINPSWVYSKSGVYEVRLIAKRIGYPNDTAKQTITINTIMFSLCNATVKAARKVIQLPNKGYAIIGNANIGGISQPFFHLLDKNGIESFPPKTYSIKGATQAEFVDFVRLSNGQFAVVGTKTRAVGAKTTQDIMYVLLSANGDTISTKVPPINMRSDDKNELGSSILLTNDENIFITGQIIYPDNNRDIYLYSSNSVLDNRNIDRIYNSAEVEEATDALEYQNNLFVVVGQIRSTASSNADPFFLTVDRLGNFQGSGIRKYTSSANESIVAVAKGSDNNVMLSGFTDANGGANLDFFLLKLDVNGQSAAGFPKVLTENNMVNDVAKDIKTLSSGGYLLSGFKNNDGFFAVLDNNGTIQLSKAIAATGIDGFNTGIPTTDGGYMFVGFCETTSYRQTKTDKNGNTQ